MVSGVFLENLWSMYVYVGVFVEKKGVFLVFVVEESCVSMLFYVFIDIVVFFIFLVGIYFFFVIGIMVGLN